MDQSHGHCLFFQTSTLTSVKTQTTAYSKNVTLQTTACILMMSGINFSCRVTDSDQYW